MTKIKVLQNKGVLSKSIFFSNDLNPSPRIIGNILKKNDVYSNSAFDYMCLKVYYQEIEKDQLKLNEYEKKTNNLVYKIQVDGQDFGIKTKNSHISILKTFVLYKNILKNKKICCEYCKKDISEKEATLDHWIPRSAGGLDELENLNVSCFRCNRAKGSIHPENDIKLLDLWKEFIHQHDHKTMLNFLLNNNYYSVEDGSYLMEKLSLSIRDKTELCLKMINNNVRLSGYFPNNISQIMTKCETDDDLKTQMMKIQDYCSIRME